jgi:hypothetical protein
VKNQHANLLKFTSNFVDKVREENYGDIVKEILDEFKKWAATCP